MQHKHVRVQSPSLQVPWTKVSVEERDPKPPQPHRPFKKENTSTDPIQTAFSIHMLVLHTTCYSWIGLYMHTQSITLKLSENQEWQLEEPDPLCVTFI